MSTLSVSHPRTDLEWPYRGDARAWELLAQVVEGKLDVQTLCERQRMRLDEVQGWLRERHRSALMAFDDQLKRALIRQGASPEALVGPELSMSLADVSIIDWIQAIQIFAKQAIITVFHAEGESRLWCAHECVIDAISGQLRGEAAFYRIAALERGQVVTELRAVHRERTIRTSTAWLLLEAVRRKDESSQLERRLGSLERLFQCSDESALARPLNDAEAALLRLFDEPRRLSEVLASSDLGDVETLATLESLIRSGQLVEAPPASEQRPRAEPGPAPPVDGSSSSASAVPIAFAWPHERPPSRRDWRWVVSTLVMGVLVSAAAWLGTQASVGPIPVATPAAAAAAAEPDSAAYAVAVRTYPADAELQVDGRVVGPGIWMARLPRDGVPHELRASAPGFISARIVFVDTAPPAEVRLDPLPVPLVAEPSSSVEATLPIPSDRAAAASLAPASTSEKARPVAVAPVSKAPAVSKASAVSKAPALRKKRSGAAVRARSSSAPAAAASAPTPTKNVPFVQIIDGDEPRVQEN